jgi:uncharacterized membrane protein YhhN
MKNKSQILQIIFWVIAAAHVIGIAANIPNMQYVTKPLLLPALIVLLASATSNAPGRKLMLAALFFSWAGDVLLMFESRDQLFFIIGLVCFLTTHVLYIIYFLSIRSTKPSLLQKIPFLILFVVAYGGGLVWLLFPKLGDLKIPVMIYAVVICTMLLCSLHVYNKVNTPANTMYVSGALFFVLSDSLLAVNKFDQPFEYAGIIIILTYCVAQYLIVNGFIEQNK